MALIHKDQTSLSDADPTRSKDELKLRDDHLAGQAPQRKKATKTFVEAMKEMADD